MITINDFFNKYIGKAVDYDGVPVKDPVQCVDLIKYYLRDVYGIKPGSYGNAKDYYLNTPLELTKQFKKIKNTKTFVPIKGDICVFDGTYGHICIATGNGDVKTFDSIDQNWNNKKCEIVTHDYKKFLGVLRKK